MVSPSKTCVVMVTICVVSRLLVSLVPRPKEKEDKGPGFSRSCMHLIISDSEDVLMSGRMLITLSKSHGQ